MRTPEEFAKEVSPTMMGLRKELEQMNVAKHIYEWMTRYAIEYHESKVGDKLITKQITHCHDCPACDGEFELCQIDNHDISDKQYYNSLHDDCILKTSNVILKLSKLIKPKYYGTPKQK